MDDDEHVRSFLDQLGGWGATPDRNPLRGDDPPTEVPGALAGVLLDLGCLHCGEATRVLGVVPAERAELWRPLFLDECARLEILPGDVAHDSLTWDEFLRAGGSAAVLGAPYRRLRADGVQVSRMLALIVSRILP